MRTAILIGIAAATAASAGCSQGRAEDGGPTVQKGYQVGNFNEVEVGGPFDVDIRTGENPGVTISGNQELIDRLKVEVRGNRLVIEPERRNGWFSWNRSRGTGSIAITVPMIRAATLAGAGDMTVNAVRGDSFEGQIAGSGDFRVDTVEVGTLKLGIAGSGDAHARSGRARSAEYNIAGSGGVDAQGISTEDVSISIAGAGDIRANASRSADVSIMGSGDVDVTGGAKCTVSKMGSGEARCS